MKPSPSIDPRVGVRPEALEQASESADAYRGIFDVTLNDLVHIMFVPRLDRSAPWPPTFPANVDLITSQAEARRTIVMLDSYVVTPDASRAETEEVVDQDGRQGVVFYVSDAEFGQFSLELERLAELLPGIHSWKPLSELQDLGLGRFITQRFVDSTLVCVEDRRRLGR
jgi:hypothetical protein